MPPHPHTMSFNSSGCLSNKQVARTCCPRSAAFLWFLEFAWVEIGRTEKAGQL